MWRQFEQFSALMVREQISGGNHSYYIILIYYIHQLVLTFLTTLITWRPEGVSYLTHPDQCWRTAGQCGMRPHGPALCSPSRPPSPVKSRNQPGRLGRFAVQWPDCLHNLETTAVHGVDPGGARRRGRSHAVLLRGRGSSPAVRHLFLGLFHWTGATSPRLDEHRLHDAGTLVVRVQIDQRPGVNTGSPLSLVDRQQSVVVGKAWGKRNWPCRVDGFYLLTDCDDREMRPVYNLYTLCQDNYVHLKYRSYLYNLSMQQEMLHKLKMNDVLWV